MRKIYQFIFILLFTCVLAGCIPVSREECLNYEDFEKFYYNGNLYVMPEELSDFNYNYSIYGQKHLVGYTIGNYGFPTETYVLDNDIEENILFQFYYGRNFDFWLKEGYELPEMTEENINKLVIKKWDDDDEGGVIETREFSLDNTSINDLFVEYSVDDSNDSFLLDKENFSKYSVDAIYYDSFIDFSYARFTFYNNTLFFQRYIDLDEKHRERKIYVLNENERAAERLYELILSLEE